ncbi:MAG: flagellar hook basal-body protein [Thermodesulfobacteriota bacterium]
MQVGWDMAAYMGTRAVRELDLVSHNLANASRKGFKQDRLFLWQVEPAKINPAEANEPQPAYYLDVRGRDFSQGAVHYTEGETDIALEGPGFFKVETPRGMRYTRDGSFVMNPDRVLQTREGYKVMSKNGAPIALNSLDQKFSIDEQGGIHMDKSLGDQLAVVDFPNPQGLTQERGGYYVAGAESGFEMEAQNVRVLHGKIEESNVDPIMMAVKLVDIQRSFEAYLKVLDTFADNDRKVVDEIGKTA